MNKKSDVIIVSQGEHISSGKYIQLDITDGIKDYGILLASNNIAYREEDYCLIVGDVIQTQGWILHITIMKYGFDNLLRTVLPFLLENNICFKIPRNENVKDDLIDGFLGYEKLGKVVTVYPADHFMTISITRQLISLTKGLRGPVIPTDVHLEGVVYTRYGSFKKNIRMNEAGKLDNYIYNSKGELVKDDYVIPFVLPKGVAWPFLNFTKPTAPKLKRIFKRKYLPFIIIKPDVKGRVIKGINISKLLKPDWCLIKEGKMGMCSDEAGRDMIDRMKWQLELHRDLSNDIPLPAIIDYFEDNSNAYLVMQFIEGSSLDVVQGLIYQSRRWLDLQLEEKYRIIDYLLEIITVIGKLHEKGYVHRDITGPNFMVDKHDKLFLIDMELSYDLKEGKPFPHFRMGTPGCMSPEQIRSEVPTIPQDIYGLGTLLLVSFIRLRSDSFDISDPTRLFENLNFFLRNVPLADCITRCLSIQSASRPRLDDIKAIVRQYRLGLEISREQVNVAPDIDRSKLASLIEHAIMGLAGPLMTAENSCWPSLISNSEALVGNRRGDRMFYMGYGEGISGTLYLLGVAKKAGLNITPCLDCMESNLQLLDQQYLHRLAELPGGFHNGTTGIAVAFKVLLDTGLIPSETVNVSFLKACLDKQVSGLDIASGASGQGIALLQCMPYLDVVFFEAKLTSNINLLLSTQLRDGSWLAVSGIPGAKAEKHTGMYYGVAGIAWFLLEYSRRFPNEITLAAACRALHWLEMAATRQGGLLYWNKTNQHKEVAIFLEDGYTGVALAFIKAYEVTREPKYREIAERTLLALPAHIVEPDFTQSRGLSGLGEVYLEASRVLKDEIWQDRASWIAGILMHTIYHKKTGGFWIINDPALPNADLLTGNSGIIYFLLHYLKPQEIGFIFLPE